ncbi:DUF3558 family protein [Pseudonocardia sp.]|uniref:DUF3558 family protein n=1 Tax=Pseudonocardia sp. TaxID=60912 RepID=UPI003D1182F2
MIRGLAASAALCFLMTLTACGAAGGPGGREALPPTSSAALGSIDPCSLVDDGMRRSLRLDAGISQSDVPVSGANSCHWFSTDREFSLVFGFFPGSYRVDDIAAKYDDAAWIGVDGRRAVRASSGLATSGTTCLLFTELPARGVAYTQVRLLASPAGKASAGPCERIIDLTRTLLASANL